MLNFHCSVLETIEAEITQVEEEGNGDEPEEKDDTSTTDAATMIAAEGNQAIAK